MGDGRKRLAKRAIARIGSNIHEGGTMRFGAKRCAFERALRHAIQNRDGSRPCSAAAARAQMVFDGNILFNTTRA